MTREVKKDGIEGLTKSSSKQVSKILDNLFTQTLPKIRENTALAQKSLNELACIFTQLDSTHSYSLVQSEVGTDLLRDFSSLFSQLSLVVETVSSKLEEKFDAKAMVGEVSGKCARIAAVEKSWILREKTGREKIRSEEKKAKKKKANPFKLETVFILVLMRFRARGYWRWQMN
jgi:hypothetical protein